MKNLNIYLVVRTWLAVDHLCDIQTQLIIAVVGIAVDARVVEIPHTEDRQA